jgi:hypothetical protein
VGLPATVDVIINCKNLGFDTVEIANERMKMARVFPAFTVKLTPIMIPVLRDDEEEEGKTKPVEEEWLVVANEGPEAGQRPTKLDEDMELMEAVLRARGSATSGEWRAAMQAITTVRKDGKVVKAGWSDATFDRRLAEFKKRHPELAGGQFQNDPYSLPIQPDGAVAERMRELAEPPSTPAPNHPHLVRGEGDEGGLECHQEPSNHPQRVSEGGSSQGSAQPSATTETDEEIAEKVRRQLG